MPLAYPYARLPRLRRPKRARNPHTVLSLYSLASRGRPRVYRYLHAYVSVSFAFATHCCVLWLCPSARVWCQPGWRPGALSVPRGATGAPVDSPHELPARGPDSAGWGARGPRYEERPGVCCTSGWTRKSQIVTFLRDFIPQRPSGTSSGTRSRSIRRDDPHF